MLGPLSLSNRVSDQPTAAAAAVQGAHQACDLVANFSVPLGRGEVVCDAAGWRTEANQGRQVSESHEMTIGGGGGGRHHHASLRSFHHGVPFSLLGISGSKRVEGIQKVQ